MCGIAGVLRGEGRADLGRLRRMSALMRHRGPDDEGILLLAPETGDYLTFGGPDTPPAVLASPLPYAPGRRRGDPGSRPTRLGFVNRRLAIVDLSAAGHGPMSDADASLWITYNGEIYNYVELRAELEQLGAKFQSGTDTEVVLAGWRVWGPRVLERLNGMFAFALWDSQTRELFCARDRFGVKPLYYQWQDGHFAFASEPRALALTQETPIRPRLEAVRDLLALDWVDHETSTFFEGIVQLPAGHSLILAGDRVRIERWWSLDPARRAHGDPEEWTREFDRLFTDAVRIRLRADVEVGSCLSGGIDSSAVVTTAAKQMSKPIHAFTCAYDEGPDYDERPYVKEVCDASGAVSHVTIPRGDDFWSVFDRLAVSQDEPTAGPGLYSQWQVMALAQKTGLKVLLDGQGGDETLAGYFRYLPVRLRDHLTDGKLGSFTTLLGASAARLGLTTTLALTFEPWLPPPLVAGLRRQFGQGKDRVLGPALRSDRLRRASPPRPDSRFATGLQRQLAFDTLQRLLPSLLRYEDRNSMAHSIETRLPFLDYRLVEFVFSLPDDQKLDRGVTKVIARRAFADRVPARVLARRDKMGFETPTDVWLRGRYAGEVRRRLLFYGPLHEWVDTAALRDELEGFLDGRRQIGLQVWRWLSLDAWARHFLEGDARHAVRGLRVPAPTVRPRPKSGRPVVTGVTAA
jgi:asparagine synthase (glutamine-hydrolysing)